MAGVLTERYQPLKISMRISRCFRFRIRKFMIPIFACQVDWRIYMWQSWGRVSLGYSYDFNKISVHHRVTERNIDVFLTLNRFHHYQLYHYKARWNKIESVRFYWESSSKFFGLINERKIELCLLSTPLEGLIKNSVTNFDSVRAFSL